MNPHPCNDGSGTIADNRLLIRAGYPPIAIRSEDRVASVASLQPAQAGGVRDRFEALLYDLLDATLTDYLTGLQP